MSNVNLLAHSQPVPHMLRYVPGSLPCLVCDITVKANQKKNKAWARIVGSHCEKSLISKMRSSRSGGIIVEDVVKIKTCCVLHWTRSKSFLCKGRPTRQGRKGCKLAVDALQMLLLMVLRNNWCVRVQIRTQVRHRGVSKK